MVGVKEPGFRSMWVEMPITAEAHDMYWRVFFAQLDVFSEGLCSFATRCKRPHMVVRFHHYVLLYAWTWLRVARHKHITGARGTWQTEKGSGASSGTCDRDAEVSRSHLPGVCYQFLSCFGEMAGICTRRPHSDHGAGHDGQMPSSEGERGRCPGRGDCPPRSAAGADIVVSTPKYHEDQDVVCDSCRRISSLCTVRFSQRACQGMQGSIRWAFVDVA